MGRQRRILRVLVVGLLVSLTTAAAPRPAAGQEQPGPLRVYVMVLDGLKADEVGALMPNLNALRSRGTWYEQARAVFPAETIPNHVAMMTGVLPGRNGIIGNQYWHPSGEGTPDYYMDQPELLEADTLTTRLESSCGAAISTATVQSKDYLYGIFRGEAPRTGDPNPQREADFHWQAPFYIPESGHIPDPFTMDAFLGWMRAQPPTLPQFAFVNLGDIDRSGHVDEVGGATSGLTTPARQAAIESTDAQIGLFVDELEQSGAWDDTVLIFTSDHNMDWGPPQQGVNVEDGLAGAGYTLDSTGGPGHQGEGDYNLVGGGGTGAVYVEDDADIADIATVLDGLEGVSFVATREPVPGLGNPTLAQMGFDHPNNGDIVVVVDRHWRVGDGNPLPGNHGHPPTQQSVLLVSGGHSLLRDAAAGVPGEAVYDPAVKLFSRPEAGPGNLSVAPTVAALFGIGQPAGGYDGAPLGEAFEPPALAPHTPCRAAALGYPRPRGATPVRVPLVPAYGPCTEPNREHGPPLAHPSCAPPRRESSDLTVGTPDANGTPASSTGSVRLSVTPGYSGTPADEADVRLELSISDVRRAADLEDYGGELQLAADVRITDTFNGDGRDEPATVVDIPFPAIAPCAPTAGPEGSTCSISSSFDAILPGAIVEGSRAIWQLGTLALTDGGSDGDPRTHPNAVFARQGLFVP